MTVAMVDPSLLTNLHTTLMDLNLDDTSVQIKYGEFNTRDSGSSYEYDGGN